MLVDVLLSETLSRKDEIMLPLVPEAFCLRERSSFIATSSLFVFVGAGANIGGAGGLGAKNPPIIYSLSRRLRGRVLQLLHGSRLRSFSLSQVLSRAWLALF